MSVKCQESLNEFVTPYLLSVSTSKFSILHVSGTKLQTNKQVDKRMVQKIDVFIVASSPPTHGPHPPRWNELYHPRSVIKILRKYKIMVMFLSDPMTPPPQQFWVAGHHPPPPPHDPPRKRWQVCVLDSAKYFGLEALTVEYCLSWSYWIKLILWVNCHRIRYLCSKSIFYFGLECFLRRSVAL